MNWNRAMPEKWGEATPPLWDTVETFAETTSLLADESHAKRSAAIVRRFFWTATIRTERQLTSVAISGYLAGMRAAGKSRKTIKNHLSALRCFCLYLVRLGRLPANPAEHVVVGRLEERVPRFLEQAEIDVVFAVARDRGFWPEVALALSTGLRLGELVRLAWSDVDLSRRVLTVRRSKSRRPRVIPLSSVALAALSEQKDKVGEQPRVFPARQTWRGGWRYIDKPRESSWWLRALRPVRDAVPKFNDAPGRSTGRGWHLFRHTFASRAVQAGVSLYKLAEWMGHRDVRSTQIYAHLAVGFDPDIERTVPTRAVKHKEDRA